MASAKIGIKTRGEGKRASMISNKELNDMLEKSTTRGRDKQRIRLELARRAKLQK